MTDREERVQDDARRCCDEAEAWRENERLRANDDLIRANHGWKRHGEELPELVRQRINEYEARIEAALALHQPWVSSTGKKFCKACSSGYYKSEHPCPTVKALKGEEGSDG